MERRTRAVHRRARGRTFVAVALAGALALATGVASRASSGSAVGAASTSAVPQERLFPADSGIVDVKARYGAKGDGVTDDTAALQRAISETSGTVYLPNGTYLVCGTLASKSSDGAWQAFRTLQGQSRSGVVIKLKDGCQGFGDAAAPRPVVMMASQNPADAELGGGNQAFENNIFDLTVDVGRGNPGAVGVDYIASNQGSMERVSVRSSDGAGAAGITMLKEWPGPGLLSKVSVDGFDYGIDVGGGQFGMTLEHVTLSGQHRAGLRLSDVQLAVRDLRSDNGVPGVVTRGSGAFLTLVDGAFTGGASGGYAVDGTAGNLFLRHVTSSGYSGALRDRGRAVGGAGIAEYTSAAPLSTGFPGPATSLALPVEEAPDGWENDLGQWANVRSYHHDGDPDDTAAIQRAIDSGKSVVYFPKGDYAIGDTVHVRGNVRRIEGMFSWFRAAEGHRFTDPKDPHPFFRFETPADGIDSVTFERFNFGVDGPYGGVAIEDASARTLSLKNTLIWGTMISAYRNTPGAGKLFLTDVDSTARDSTGPAADWRFTGQDVWMRQFNPEATPNVPLAVNTGGRVWVLGMKTEGEGPFFETLDHGWTELLGAYDYLNEGQHVDQANPAYLVRDSSFSMTLSTTAYTDPAGSDHDVYVRETRGGVTRDLGRGATYGRNGDPGNYSRLVPLVTAYAEAAPSAPPPAPSAPAGTPAPADDPGPVADGTYALIGVQSGKALDVSGCSTQDWARLQIWPYAGRDCQKWQVTALGDGTYKLISMRSGKALDVAQASTEQGAPVIQYGYHGNDNQRWRFARNGDGSYSLLSEHSGLALDVGGCVTDDGTKLIQWPNWHGSCQTWKLEPA